MDDKAIFRLTDKQINIETLKRVMQIQADLQALSLITLIEIGKLKDSQLENSESNLDSAKILMKRFHEISSETFESLVRDIYPDILEG